MLSSHLHVGLSINVQSYIEILRETLQQTQQDG
jgi:hypothetical protein